MALVLFYFSSEFITCFLLVLPFIVTEVSNAMDNHSSHSVEFFLFSNKFLSLQKLQLYNILYIFLFCVPQAIILFCYLDYFQKNIFAILKILIFAKQTALRNDGEYFQTYSVPYSY